MRFAIAVGRFYEELAERLVAGARAGLAEAGRATRVVVESPGRTTGHLILAAERLPELQAIHPNAQLAPAITFFAPSIVSVFFSTVWAFTKTAALMTIEAMNAILIFAFMGYIPPSGVMVMRKNSLFFAVQRASLTR